MALELEDTAAPADGQAPAASGPAARARTSSSPMAFTETAVGPVPASVAPRLPGESLAPGRQLAHFRIERLLGAGGMGEVYLATDLALDRPVALKVLAQGSSSAARRERLIREARAQARILHPNVCHIYYIGESDGLLFFAMELVTGKTFSERLAAGPLEPDVALELVRKAALGLREATRCGFTHRDVKPSNLMIDQHGEVKVMDFGLVAGSLDGDESGRSVEQTSLAGTPLYMAPEQARGDAIDFRADIYALGATLYHLVAGKPPFHGDSAAELMQLHADAERPLLARADLSARALAPVQALCAKMMAPDPALRHGSYDELVREIELLSSVHSRPAGATVRCVAASLDLLLLIPALMALMALATLVAPSWRSSDLLAISVMFGALRIGIVPWLGRSPGQSLFELEVVSTRDGRWPSRRQMLRRTLLLFSLPLAASLVEVAATAGVRWLRHVDEAALALAYVGLVVHVYFASVRRARRRTFWDRHSDTLVRYRIR